MLPLRSFFVALLFVLIPAIANKLAAAPGQTHYFGDHQRRSLDGSLRHDPYTDLSASPAYRARPHERVMQPYAATYDGVPLMAPIWTGVHGGVHGGGGWGSIETSLGDADISGALFGAHLGFLVRSGAVAAGLELDADYSMLHHAARLSDTAVLMADVNWVVSARARLGVVAGPAFFYATGGVAMIDGSARVEVTGGGYGQWDRTAPALVVGGGAEIGIGEGAAMRLEALHYLANEKRYAIPDGSTARFGGDMTTVRVGLTFYFN